MLIFNYFNNKFFMWFNNPIDLIFGIMIPRTTKFNIISDASISIINFQKCKYVLNYYPIFKKFSTNLLTIFSTFIHLYSNFKCSMFVCSAVSQLRFYGCFHPCLYIFSSRVCLASTDYPSLSKYKWVMSSHFWTRCYSISRVYHYVFKYVA